MTLKFNNIIIDVPNKNKTYKQKYLRLVNDVSGELEYNQLTAIMGPSGCGKSTLIASLVGRIQPGSKTSGSITIDGEQREYRSFIKQIGMLEQDDDVFPALTLKETLEYAIAFRLDELKKGKDELIDDTLSNFGLSNLKLNHMCKLSGGERKRAMLAIELITDAKIIFADEPTSGLDTKTALRIMKLLKREAEKGKMVVVCIHQPSIEIYSLFDKLMLMSEAQMVYLGDPATFESILAERGVIKRENISFPDFIAELVVKEDSLENEDNREENKNYCVVKELIKDNIGKDMGFSEKQGTKNDTINDYRINLEHIWLIQSREWKITLRKPFQILKTMAITALLSLIMILINSQIKKETSHILRAKQLDKDIETLDAIQLHARNYLLFNSYFVCEVMLIYRAFYMTFTLLTSTSTFFSSAKIIKREISTGTYSSTSYVFGKYIHQVVRTILFLFPCLVIFLSTVFNKYTMTAIIYHILLPIMAMPFAFALGSISKNRKVILAISSIITIPIIFPPNFIFVLFYWINLLTTSFLRYILTFLFTILVLSPTFYFNTLFSLAIETMLSSYDKFIKCREGHTEKVCTLLIYSRILNSDNITQIFPFFYQSLISKISIFLGLTILVTSFAIHRQSNFLMPSIRMKLTK